MSARGSSAKWAVLLESDSDSDSDVPVIKETPHTTAPVKKTSAKTAKTVRWADGISFPKPSAIATEVFPASAPASVKIGFTGDMDAILAAMMAGERTWGDIMMDLAAEDVTPSVVDVALPVRSNKWDDFWALPFAAQLREVWGDLYDCSSLTDAEWNEMMRWLFDAGWDVQSYDRNGVEFEEDNGPRRSWIPPEELEAMLAEEAALRRRTTGHGHCHSHSHSHAPRKVEADAVADAAPKVSGRPEKKKSTSSVPRFCREAGACKEEACRYVHGDTIPRVNRPCGFGADCGKGDAAKRALCLYMHPGETWTDGLVVRRPVAAAADVASAE